MAVGAGPPHQSGRCRRPRERGDTPEVDLLAYFAALRPADGPARTLVYAFIGLYVIEEGVPARDVPRARWAENAHTRRVPGDTDISSRKSASQSFTNLLPQTVAGTGRSDTERQVISEPDTSSRHPIQSLGLGDTLRYVQLTTVESRGVK